MKIRVAVVFGGESVEHEISIISAHQAMENFDKEKYEIIPIYISKESTWYTGEVLTDLEHFKDLDFIEKNAKEVRLISEKSRYYLYEYPFKMLKNKPVSEFDIIFPIVHGTNVEDGTLQGLFDALKIPYVGPSTSAAAVGQDKVMMKLIWQASTLPVVPYIWFYASQWEDAQGDYISSLEKQLGYPMIIKPASLGSSVGISIAKDKEQLIESINEAKQYDRKILVEKALTNFTEVNCSVLGDLEQTTPSVIEKVFSGEELLSYQDKYGGGSSDSGKFGDAVKGAPTKGSELSSVGVKGTKLEGGMANTSREVPAKLDEKLTVAIQKLAELSFKTLSMSGVSRIDFLIDNETNKVYLNEINTIPGSLSFYLWEATGKTFASVLDEMIQMGINRFRLKEKNVFTYDTNVLAMQGNNTGGTKGAKGSKGMKQ